MAPSGRPREGIGGNPRALFRYYLLVLSRASKDTRAWFAWRPELIIFPGLYVVGFLWLSVYKGFDFARDEVIANFFLSFIPAAIFAAFIFIMQLAMAPVRIWKESRSELDSLATGIAALYFGGENIKQSIIEAGEETDPDTTYLREISVWRERVGHWLLVNDSPASMMMFAPVPIVDCRVHYRYGGKNLSEPQEAAYQLMEEYLRRLGEIMEHHWGAKKT